MKRSFAALLGLSALAVPAAAAAHFILLSPEPFLEQNQLGNPQKAWPCGEDAAADKVPTGVVSEFTGGQSIPLKVQETIYHPGHYRVALSVLSRDELPVDPETVTRDTERGPYSVSAKIDPDPAPPVIADGIFEHHERPEERGVIYETEITLPNINCDNCTLQVIQWMAEHGLNAEGDFTYHHCADIRITANPNLPIDTRWPGQ